MSSMPTKHAHDRPITLVRSCWLGRPASPAVRLYTGGQAGGCESAGQSVDYCEAFPPLEHRNSTKYTRLPDTVMEYLQSGGEQAAHC